MTAERQALATLKVGDLIRGWPFAAVLTPEDIKAMSELPAPVAPTPPAR